MQSITDEEYKQFRAEQKAQRDAFYAAKLNNLKTVTTRKPHVCAAANLFLSGQKQGSVFFSPHDYNYYYGFTTKYFCLNCRPIAAKVEA